MKKKIIIVLIFIILGVSAFIGGKYLSIVKNNKNNENIKISANKSKLDILDERSEQAWKKTQALAKQKGFIAVEAKENGSYNAKQPIRLSKNFYVTLENASMTNISITGQNYVVIDFTILNISTKDYYNDLSNFDLQDQDGYTYKPDISYNVTGDIEGNIPKDKGMKRGEVAFKVANGQTNFVLTFSPANLPENSYNIQSINFKLNFSKLQN